jgi:4'-phosphopantetheinyl transferase
LDQPRSIWTDLEPLLSPDEHERASRFIFERDRRQFVVCRGVLRLTIGDYLGIDASAVSFAYATTGKPSLQQNVGLWFNVSHAGGLALLAFSGEGPLGVDLESLDRVVDAEALAPRFFAADETRDLMSVAQSQRTEAFLNGWTRKESYIKATGEGLTRPLDSFSVTLRPGEPAAVRWIEGDDASAWHLRAFQPARGFVAALAGRHEVAQMDLWEWDGKRERGATSQLSEKGSSRAT